MLDFDAKSYYPFIVLDKALAFCQNAGVASIGNLRCGSVIPYCIVSLPTCATGREIN
jgi:hypothetical protein